MAIDGLRLGAASSAMMKTHSDTTKRGDVNFALLNSVSLGRYRQTKLLVEAGSNVNCTDEYGRTPLQLCCLHVKDPRRFSRLVRLLVDSGADPNFRDEKGRTVLMQTVCLGLTDVITHILQQSDVNLELQDNDGNTLLMHAASFGQAEAVAILLKQMGRLRQVLHLTQRNNEGYTALELAEKNGHYDIVSVLGGTDRPPPLCHSGLLDRGPTPSTPLSFPTRWRMQVQRRRPSREDLLKESKTAREKGWSSTFGDESGSRTTYPGRAFPSLSKAKSKGEAAVDLNSSYSSTVSEPFSQEIDPDFDAFGGEPSAITNSKESSYNDVLNRLDLSIKRVQNKNTNPSNSNNLTGQSTANGQQNSRTAQVCFNRNYFPPIRSLNKECRTILAKHKDSVEPLQNERQQCKSLRIMQFLEILAK